MKLCVPYLPTCACFSSLHWLYDRKASLQKWQAVTWSYITNWSAPIPSCGYAGRGLMYLRGGWYYSTLAEGTETHYVWKTALKVVGRRWVAHFSAARVGNYKLPLHGFTRSARLNTWHLALWLAIFFTNFFKHVAGAPRASKPRIMPLRKKDRLEFVYTITVWWEDVNSIW